MGLRILHVVESAAPEAGSVSVLLDGLFDALKEKHVDTQAVYLNGSSASSLKRHSDAWSELDVAADERVMAERVADSNLVHFHGWGYASARRLAVATGKAGKPYVISPLGSLSYGPYRKRSWTARLVGPFRDAPIVRGAAAITTGNAWEAENLFRGRIHANVVRIPYGVNVADYDSDEVERAATTDKTGGRSVLMLGPVHPVEGLVPLLKAVYELGPYAEGWNVVMAGEEIGDWRKMLEPAIARKGGANRVRFAEAPDVASQSKWLRQASLLAAPSLHTRCPVSVMQAAAAGVPVVTSIHSAPLGMEDEMWVYGTTRVELKITLRKIVELSDEERVAMANRARDVVRSRFAWSALVDDYVKLYQRLV